MREAVPDVVAQEFLRRFLSAFSAGQSLSVAVRNARERLERLEDQFPCATWLPVIYQNPAETPLTWQVRDDISQQKVRSPLPQLRSEKEPSPPLVLGIRHVQAIGLISLVVTAFVMGVRYLGLLQPLELWAFDQLQRLRPEETADPRLLVVTITEADIQAQPQRKGSLSDPTLAQLLAKLEQYHPRVIGLDLYRDFSVEPKYRDLVTRLQQQHHLIAVCKSKDTDFDPDGVAPPPEIPAERVGFSDFLEDPDGMLRRHLLMMTLTPDSPCKAHYGFSVLLALQYLAAEGILPKFTAEGNLELGNTVFRRLQPHAGFYHRADLRGNQVLLNYRSAYSPQKIADQMTLTQVLNKPIDLNLVKDRIVLIGTTASSSVDEWSTPFGAGPTEKIPGVIIQAQMVSQLLSAVLDRRPLLQFWSTGSEVLWIWIWAVVGGCLAVRCPSLLHLELASAIILAVLSGLCFVFFLSGSLVPLVPAAIAVVITSGAVRLYTRTLPNFSYQPSYYKPS
jgi:CHASE2 domain-containing sensor protein